MNIQHLFEEKVSLPQVRRWLASLCLSPLGRHLVEEMRVMTSAKQINQHLACTGEMRHLLQVDDAIPVTGYHDMTDALKSLRVEGSYLSLDALSHLRSMLTTLHQSLTAVRQKVDDNADSTWATPTLASLAQNISLQPQLLAVIDRIVTPHGDMRDDASPELMNLRQQIRRETQGMSGRVQRILSTLQQDDIVDADASVVVREGVLLLAVPAMHRNRVAGIVHGESQGGNLVYVEPQEVVQANQRLRQLQGDERNEIVRVLKRCADSIRPERDALLQGLRWLAIVDYTRAKALLAEAMQAVEPKVSQQSLIDWADAYHPLLRKHRTEQGQSCVPLTIQLTSEQRMLVISGPNAGGKSVCLKTVGLLQCMVQCGLSVPMSAASKVGVFQKMMIDIGDDQSIDDELSTYSSHLRHLKRMMQDGDARTLLLIDELGGGTEPTAGGAIAEVVLEQLLQKRCLTVVTTHYQNLKLFASTHEGVQNGAMLYDDANMQPMYQLVQGQAGSSFALDIARRVGFPPSLIDEVKEHVGEQYVKQERFLHDVYRDRRYWSSKRKSVAQLEKQLQERIEKYTLKRQRLIDERDNILRQARLQAEQLMADSNKLIESTIRSIRESGADKESTKAARQQMKERQQQLLNAPIGDTESAQHATARRKKGKAKVVPGNAEAHSGALRVGAAVKIKGMGGIGIVEALDERTAVVATGNVRLRIERKKLESDFELSHQMPVAPTRRQPGLFVDPGSLTTSTYSTSIDLRGQRAEEALAAVEQFIDETVVRGMSVVRILHGKGDGILSSVIRKYLADRKEVKSFHDEHVDFGGAGITVVEME